MVVLRESLLLLQFCGVWPPRHLKPGTWKYRAYSLYTIIIVAVAYWFTISGLINLFITINDITDFSDSCFMLLTMLATCCKILITLVKRSEIRGILDDLERYPYKAVNADEQKIQDMYDGQVR